MVHRYRFSHYLPLLLACVCFPAVGFAAVAVVPADEDYFECAEGFEKVQEVPLFETATSTHYFEEGTLFDGDAERIKATQITIATWTAIDKVQAAFEAMTFPNCLQPDCTVSMGIVTVSPAEPEDAIMQLIACTQEPSRIDCVAAASGLVLRCERPHFERSEELEDILEDGLEEAEIHDELDLEPYPSSSSSSSSSMFSAETSSSSSGMEEHSPGEIEEHGSSGDSSSSSGESTSSSAETLE